MKLLASGKLSPHPNVVDKFSYLNHTPMLIGHPLQSFVILLRN
jgi:hypothetical protein